MAPRSTQGSYDPWSDTASRAAHPSMLGAAPSWCWAVASGLGRVTVPWADREPAPGSIASETVLSTPTYDAIVTRWGAGAMLDLAGELAFGGALYVVAGTIDLIAHHSRTGVVHDRCGEGGGAVLDDLRDAEAVNAGPDPAVTVHVIRRGRMAA